MTEKPNTDCSIWLQRHIFVYYVPSNRVALQACSSVPLVRLFHLKVSNDARYPEDSRVIATPRNIISDLCKNILECNEFVSIILQSSLTLLSCKRARTLPVIPQYPTCTSESRVGIPRISSEPPRIAREKPRRFRRIFDFLGTVRRRGVGAD